MKCPIDDTTLAITERQGIEIDYCPQCRGVWLDRGELDKLIEGGAKHSSGSSHERPPERYDERRSGSHGYDTSHGYHKKKKKESWLGEIFDF